MLIKNDEQITEILRDSKTIAVVGASPDPNRSSHGIMEALIKDGYDVVPVNPKYEEVLGRKCFPTVASIGKSIDIVDVFRRSEFVDEVARDAVDANAKIIWMQLGVINEDAAQYASEHGLKVIMDKCIMIERRRLLRKR